MPISLRRLDVLMLCAVPVGRELNRITSTFSASTISISTNAAA